MLQDKQAKEEERQKERRWACLHRLKKRGNFRGRRGRGARVGWAIAFHPPRYHVAYKHWLYHSWRYYRCSRCHGYAISLKTPVGSGWCGVRQRCLAPRGCCYGLPQALPEASSGASPSHTGVHFIGVYLMGVYLISVHFMGVYLMGVYLMGVHLMSVYFMGVYLMGCTSWDVPHGMYLMGVYLTGAHLIGVYLTGVHLTDVHLMGVHLMGVYLT
jgi:hypothetical protein